MASFLSTSQKTEIDKLYNKLHDTFAQSITVYKNGKKTLIAHDPKYNAVYGRNNLGSRDSVEYETISKKFDARIYYIKTEEELLQNNADSQVKVITPNGSVKVIVREDGFKFIQEARRVEFDGRKFSIQTDGSPYGLTSNLFYTFFLTPLDESTDQ